MAVPRLAGPDVSVIGIPSATQHFTTHAKLFATTCTALRKALEDLAPTTPRDALAATTPRGTYPATPHAPKAQLLATARQRLIECRCQYKQIESFLEYFFRSSSTIYNRPPKYETEEPGMEYQTPVGLQVIESLLYDTRIDHKTLLEQAKAVESSATDLPALLYDFTANDRQLLESLRLELIRIIALDITGYEAPLLRSGIKEAYTALVSFSDQLQPYLQIKTPHTDSLLFYLDQAMAMVRNSNNFDRFDRLSFLKKAALPLQRQFGLLIREKGLEANTGKALNYAADDIFSPDALIPPGQDAPRLRALGRQLFSDPSLSTNNKESCASCHNPAKAFTDGRVKSLAFDGHHQLDRNAPTLLYSGFQYSQFWDGRVHTLEDQVRTVLHDQREMHADTTTLARHGGAEQVVTALAAYVRSLHPMNSPFDRYLHGPDNILTEKAKKGANLFMGKAQCATCHFIPLFNGLIPPYYALTEFEVLGTTTSDNFAVPRLSSDAGRYTLYPFPFYKGAFKTPTVRNSANTAPYMHNGAFHSLATLLDFYNKGGGAGLGLPVPNQTLSPIPLHLSKDEMNNIIIFIHALTDSLNINP